MKRSVYLREDKKSDYYQSNETPPQAIVKLLSMDALSSIGTAFQGTTFSKFPRVLVLRPRSPNVHSSERLGRTPQDHAQCGPHAGSL